MLSLSKKGMRLSLERLVRSLPTSDACRHSAVLVGSHEDEGALGPPSYAPAKSAQAGSIGLAFRRSRCIDARASDRTTLSIDGAEVEAAELVGYPIETDEQARAAAGALLDRGAQAVIITLGARGAFYHTTGQREFVPAVSAGNVIDTTGAGDAFLARPPRLP